MFAMLENTKLLQMKLQSIRRKIHMNPELAYHEFEADELIKSELAYHEFEADELIKSELGAYGVPFRSHVARPVWLEILEL